MHMVDSYSVSWVAIFMSNWGKEGLPVLGLCWMMNTVEQAKVHFCSYFEAIVL